MGDDERRFWFRSSGKDLANAANSTAGKAALAAGVDAATNAVSGGDDDDDDDAGDDDGDDDDAGDDDGDDDDDDDDDDEEGFWFRSSGKDLANAANSTAGKAALA